jgi:hypothetical protein
LLRRMEGRFWRSPGSAISWTFTDAQLVRGFQAEIVALRCCLSRHRMTRTD